MSWITSILDVYWDLRPCLKTQELYKSHNLKPSDYIIYELKYLTQSTWKKDEEFMSLNGIEYLLNKYPGEKINLDNQDRIELGNRFLFDLGITYRWFILKID
jgi:hypothetical protein